MRGDQETIASFTFPFVEIMAFRRQYTKEEDDIILAYLQDKLHLVNGNAIWREAENQQVTISCNIPKNNPHPL